MAVTRLSGGLTPANGSDPRTFPAIWNATADDIEQAETDIATIEANDWVTTARIDDGAVTAPKLANTAGAVMVFDDAAARTTAIPTPVEGMVTYLSDVNQVQAYTGAAFTPVGTILQVVSTAKTNTFSTTSQTFTGVTGLTAAITPSSTSSKILIMAQVSIANAPAANHRYLRLSGGNATSFVGDADGSRIRVVHGSYNHTDGSAASELVTMLYLDSPNTTSSVTYSVDVAVGGPSSPSLVINRTSGDTDSALFNRSASSITVMEVAG
jgi:hypothetical protein